MHRDYLKFTKEHVETLLELLKEARALKPLDAHIGHASKFAERIQELLVYVSASCPFTKSRNEKVSYTDASGSKPKGDTKNDKIQRPSRRSKNNKVEAQPRKSKSSSNKNNHVSNYNANIKNVALLKNLENVCLSCNECLKWILTGRTFNLVGKLCPPSRNTSTIVVPPGKILITIGILIDEPCPKLSLRYAKVRESLSRSFLNFDIHPFNLHDFGFERMLSKEEFPP
ncbi:hypothetical protein Tco_1416297 [Tanacetum coccineum]